MEVVESSKNIEVSIMHPDNTSELLDDATVDLYVKLIEKEREDAEAAK
jgi:hypothetical protein